MFDLVFRFVEFGFWMFAAMLKLKRILNLLRFGSLFGLLIWVCCWDHKLILFVLN